MAIHIQFNLPGAVHSGFHRAAVHASRGGLIAWLGATAARWRQRRLLEELDDRALRDMGISRSEALAEARKPFWRG